MNRQDYRKIARRHKVSIAEVKRDMQEAINVAYKNPTLQANCVPRKGDAPTVDELINYTANRVKSLQKINEKDEQWSDFQWVIQDRLIYIQTKILIDTATNRKRLECEM